CFKADRRPGLLVKPEEMKIIDANNSACDLFCLMRSDLILLRLPEIAEEELCYILATFNSSAEDDIISFKCSRHFKNIFEKELEITLTRIRQGNETTIHITVSDSPSAAEPGDLLFENCRAIVDLIPEPLCLLKKNGLILDANSALEKLSGWNRSELVGKHFTFFSHPSELEKLLADFNKLSDGENVTAEIRFLTKSGKYITAETCSTPVTKNGAMEMIISACRDISARKKSESELKKNESKLRSILDNMDDRAWIKDIKNRYVFINSALEKYLGTKAEHIVGKSDLEIFETETAIKLISQDLEIANSKKKKRFETLVKPLGGVENYIETVKSPLYDQNKNIIGTVGIARNITERKRDEDILKYRLEWENLLLKLLTKFTDVKLADIDGEITAALGEIGNFSGVDRCYIFLFDENITMMSNTHEWCRKGIEPMISQNQNIPFFIDSYWGKKLEKFEINYVANIKNLPPEAEHERKLLMAESIKSLVSVPIISEKAPIGFIGFDSVRHEKVWPDEDITMLKIVSEIMSNILIRQKIEKEVSIIKSELFEKSSFHNLIGKSPQIKKIMDIIPIVSESDCNILIEGPSGTGKNLVACLIHKVSPRSSKPFVIVNCGAIPETLLESELFGYTKGAFTDARKDKPGKFESASGGIVVLDEIGEMPLSLQVKLLQVIEEKKYSPLGSNEIRNADVRIIAATNNDLSKMVREKKFRLDLYFRLKIVSIKMPPLIERREDIELLTNYFIQILNDKYFKNVTKISSEALELIMKYDFPGNVRELQNMLESAYVFCNGTTLKKEHFPEEYTSFSKASAPAEKSSTAKANVSQKKHLKDIRNVTERDAIIQALELSNGNRNEASKSLNISRIQLWRKMNKYNIFQDSRKT
ncbi:MAG TPA: sigma 54-interacting transcriptional regulator, partial [Candidatus Wallbacteria bacterium]|nr:sigma 54-interacting transcriptional regulator [Candidatus Wallbacteria bacterium]